MKTGCRGCNSTCGVPNCSVCKGKTLCRSGFHKWKLDKAKVFDVKLGKLVTSYRCERCGAVKNESR